MNPSATPGWPAATPGCPAATPDWPAATPDWPAATPDWPASGPPGSWYPAFTAAEMERRRRALAGLATPLTWRRILLIAAVPGAFALLFPVPAVRNFYAMELPRGELGITLLIAALGVAALTIFWALARRRTSG